MARPWRSRSSPVFTTTVSPGPRCAASPWASFAPPTPPASSTTAIAGKPRRGCASTLNRPPRSIREAVTDLADPVDGLAVVRGWQSDDDVSEAELVLERADLVGDVGRRAEEMRDVAGVLGAVVGRQEGEGGLRVGLPIADDDRKADRALDRGGIA